jgi:V8-like Glu-specific endopeptidase
MRGLIWRRSAWLTAIGAVAAATSLLGGPAQAASGPGQPATGGHPGVGGQPATWAAPAGADYQRQVRAFWTPERIRGAVPDEVPSMTGPVDKPAASVAVGKPGHVDGAAPAGGSVRTDAAKPAVDGDGKAARWTGPSDQSPTTTTGAVLFSRGGKGYICSGSVVNSEAKNMVMTAGHCLYRDGQYSSNVVFIPGFDEGAMPFGQWTAGVLAPSPQWISDQDFHYDWAFMLMLRDSAGRRLADVTGSQGIAWNYPMNQHMWVFGYPAQPPYDGQQLWYCLEWTWPDGLNKRNMGMMCTMNGGSSGGPWIMGGDTPAYAWVNGVTSYTYGNNALYTSFFGSDVDQCYQRFRGWTT